MKTYAIDFETYYDNDVSLKVQGVWGYLNHPRADIYMVSVVGDDGLSWVGHPKDFDWPSIAGPGTRWIASNMQFDGAVYERIVELGVAPAVYPEEFLCTADMCSFLGFPRSLKGGIETVFKGEIEVSKDVRNAMKGQKWEDMTPDFQEEVRKYALHDSYCCLQLWLRLNHLWPAHERMMSKHTMAMAWQGLPVNRDKIENAILTLKDHIWEAEGKIPWAKDHPPLSPKQLAEACRKEGIEPPRSLAKDSEECAEWEDQYGERFPWVDAMRTYRRCNAMIKKFETMRDRIKTDGRMDIGILYCGAHTLRDSGAGGLNILNFPRNSMFGTNMRECIEAPEGKTLVICDLSQIEPRVLSWFAKDHETLKLLSGGMGPYEAHARATMGWTGGKLKAENPQMYALSKMRTLGLGFGSAWEKFVFMAKAFVSPAEFDGIFKIKPTSTDRSGFEEYLKRMSAKKRDGKFAKYLAMDEEDKWVCINSWVQVKGYRDSNPKIIGLWHKMDQALRTSVGGDLDIEFPNGRVFKYRNLQKGGDSISCAQVRNGKWTRVKIFATAVVENITQALARDVYMDCVRRILVAGHNIIMRVHDEVVIECDEADAERVLAEVSAIMHTAPTWIPSLPLAAEGEITKVYKK